MQPFRGKSFHSREWIVSLQIMNRPSSGGGWGRGIVSHHQGWIVSFEGVCRFTSGGASFQLREWIVSFECVSLFISCVNHSISKGLSLFRRRGGGILSFEKVNRAISWSDSSGSIPGEDTFQFSYRGIEHMKCSARINTNKTISSMVQRDHFQSISNIGANSLHSQTWQCDRVVKVMDSKSIGLCPQGFKSPRCRFAMLPFVHALQNGSWAQSGKADTSELATRMIKRRDRRVGIRSDNAHVQDWIEHWSLVQRRSSKEVANS